MSNEIASRPEQAWPASSVSQRRVWADELMEWAAAAQKAHEIASVLCETSFVPKSMQHRPGEVTGAILTGMELGVPIMWALDNIDLIDGRPAIRAKALRALSFRGGHEIWTEESTASRAIVCGRRKGSSRVERSVWTLDRAKKAGLLGKKNWQQYGQDMLLNRATAEVFRLIAPDELIGVSHTIDELGGDEESEAVPVAEEKQDAAAPAKRRTAQRAKPAATEPAALPADIPAPDDPPREERPPVVSEGRPRRPVDDAAVEVVDVIDGMEEPPGEAPPDAQPAADNEQPVDEPVGEVMMTEPQRRRMHIAFRDVGLIERDERLAFSSHVIGREIGTSNDLTAGEASEILSALLDEGLTEWRRKINGDGGE